MTKTNTTEAARHQAEGHNVMVQGGCVRCVDCDETFDTSGARPGLVEANQFR